MRPLIVSLALILVLSSCATGYIPNAVNTPMLSKKGEFQASALYTTSSWNFQTAYALSDKIGLIANGNFHSSEYEDPYDPSVIDYWEKSSFGEIGGGYTFSRTDRFQFDLYGGLGGGRIASVYPGDDYYSFNGYNFRAFVQPSLGLVNKIVEITFTPRISYVQVHDVFIGSGNEIYRDLFVEPHFVAKVGYKNFKFVSQVGIIVPVPLLDWTVGANPFSLGLGVQYILGGGRWEE